MLPRQWHEPPKKRINLGARNGLLPPEMRLSIALRYFAGGDPYDIMLVHGVSHAEIYRSVWKVVDAVNHCP